MQYYLVLVRNNGQTPIFTMSNQGRINVTRFPLRETQAFLSAPSHATDPIGSSGFTAGSTMQQGQGLFWTLSTRDLTAICGVGVSLVNRAFLERYLLDHDVVVAPIVFLVGDTPDTLLAVADKVLFHTSEEGAGIPPPSNAVGVNATTRALSDGMLTSVSFHDTVWQFAAGGTFSHVPFSTGEQRTYKVAPATILDQASELTEVPYLENISLFLPGNDNWFVRDYSRPEAYVFDPTDPDAIVSANDVGEYVCAFS